MFFFLFFCLFFFFYMRNFFFCKFYTFNPLSFYFSVFIIIFNVPWFTSSKLTYSLSSTFICISSFTMHHPIFYFSRIFPQSRTQYPSSIRFSFFNFSYIYPIFFFITILKPSKFAINFIKI